MLGLVQLAARLAESRTYGRRILTPNGGIAVAPRWHAFRQTFRYRGSAEFYSILDRLSRGEKP